MSVSLASVGVAMRRGEHQRLGRPVVLSHPHPLSVRAFLALRSRLAEEVHVLEVDASATPAWKRELADGPARAFPPGCPLSSGARRRALDREP